MSHTSNFSLLPHDVTTLFAAGRTYLAIDVLYLRYHPAMLGKSFPFVLSVGIWIYCTSGSAGVIKLCVSQAQCRK